MSPREALNLLDSNVANLNGTREAHVGLQTAINVLNGLVLEGEARGQEAADDREVLNKVPEHDKAEQAKPVIEEEKPSDSVA
jgi:hypothetical protein